MSKKVRFQPPPPPPFPLFPYNESHYVKGKGPNITETAFKGEFQLEIELYALRINKIDTIEYLHLRLSIRSETLGHYHHQTIAPIGCIS